MGLQYWKCPANALFTLGIFQIVGNMQKRKTLIDDVMSDFFIDADTKAGWAKIASIIEPHGTSKTMLTGATPSKPIRQGDGQFSPFMIQRQHANLCMMYEQANSLGIIRQDVEEDYMKMWWNFADFPFENQSSTLKWNAVISAYEVIREMEGSTALMLEAIKPLYNSNKVYDKTPMEVQFFAGDMMNGNVMIPDGLCNIPWSTINQFKTDNPLDLGIIDVILEKDPIDLWYLPVPTITFGVGSESFSGCGPTTTYVKSSNIDCFCKEGSFIPDPPDPPPPSPPSPTYVSGNVTPDLFSSDIWKVEIIPGNNTVITGTVNINYRRMIVTFP